MPSKLPLVSISAPPELPKLMAASVCMKFSKWLMCRLLRPSAEMMPMVTVWPTPKGLPMASTTSPTRACSAWPSTMTDSLPSDTLMTARSVSGSVPTTLAAAVRQRHLDVVGRVDDVVVGQNIAVGADDDARAEAGLLVVLVVAVMVAVAEEFLEEGVAQQRMVAPPQRLAGHDVDHGRHGARGRVAVGTGRRRAASGLHQRRAGRDRADRLDPAGHAQRAVRPHRRVDAIQRQRDGHRLRKQ